MFKYYSILLLFILSAGLSERCYGHATKPVTPVTLPKEGTIIINTYYVTDSSGAIVPKTVVDPKIDDDTIRVIHSGIRIFGRSNCAAFASLTSQDTSLISYAGNGDLYMWQLGKDTAWALLPFGMPPGKVLRKKFRNDSGTFLLRHFNMPHRRTWEVVGMDTASAAGNIYPCIKLQMVDIRTYQKKEWRQGMLYWYSPKLGYFPRINFGWNGPYFLNQQVKVYREPNSKQ